MKAEVSAVSTSPGTARSAGDHRREESVGQSLLQDLQKEPTLPVPAVRTSGLLNWDRTRFPCPKPVGAVSYSSPRAQAVTQGGGCPPSTGRRALHAHLGQPAAGPDDTAVLLVCSQAVTTWHRGCRHRNGKPVARWLCIGCTGWPPLKKFTSLHFSQFFKEKKKL